MKYIVRSVDGDEYGPFSREELQMLVREERLGPGDFIRRETGRTWSPFDKIAGLGRTSGTELEEEPIPADGISPTRPIVGAEIGSGGDSGGTPEEVPEPEEIVPIEPATEPAETTTPPFNPVAIDDSDPSPFIALGLPMTMDAGEQTCCVVVQSFRDALRESLFNALLGHRGTLVCTNRRIVVVRPSAIRSSMHVAWMDSVNMASIESRRSVPRTIAAIVFLMYAVSSLAGGIVSGLAADFAIASGVGGSLFSMASIAGVGIASFAALIGLLALLTCRRRAMVVSTSGAELVFGCAALGPWHLAQIDAARMSTRVADQSRGRSSPPTAP